MNIYEPKTYQFSGFTQIYPDSEVKFRGVSIEKVASR